MNENIFITFIRQGKITNRQDLKQVYRRMVLKTHPDSVGSERLVGKFIELGKCYEEAMEYLALNNADASVDLQALPSNFRLSFFRALKKRQDLELAFNTRIKNNGSEMAVADQEASFCFSQWRTADSDLYVAANREYIKLRSEKPEGPYRKKALYFNLRPVLHNIISYHLTGREFYRTQVRQNLAAVRQRLAEREFYELDRFIQILLADLQHGPALFG